MKIRTDFVTNSSSSSFVSVHVSGGKLTEIMSRFKTALEGLSASNEKQRKESMKSIKSGESLTETTPKANIWASVPDFSDDVLYFELTEKIKPPKTKEEIFSLLLRMANKLYENSGEIALLGELSQDLTESKDELLSTLGTFEFETHDMYYGDSVGDVIDIIVEEYAHEYLGIPEDREIDEETLNNFYFQAMCSVSEFLRTYSYNGETVEYKEEKFTMMS